MKKTWIIIIISLLSFTTSQAQIKAGFGVGFVSPSGDLADIAEGGLTITAEAGYGVLKQLDVSLLYQLDIFAEEKLGGVNLATVKMGTVLANARYYFREDGFQPYVGLGIGLASIKQGDYSIVSNGINVNVTGFDESNFAFRPALGFKYGILNVHTAYLNAGKVEESTVGDLTFNIGLLFTFGG
ncbi:hypothetical protein ACFSTE_14455 [Aquimarina hainanensis]|uniref:Outer membrane protein beta-barrel domain-containing protein n=1 Tax=Aquimarina hainanensis TaxID=1578017 RepID=A0ABW5N8Z3_9FLAO